MSLYLKINIAHHSSKKPFFATDGDHYRKPQSIEMKNVSPVNSLSNFLLPFPPYQNANSLRSEKLCLTHSYNLRGSCLDLPTFQKQMCPPLPANGTQEVLSKCLLFDKVGALELNWAFIAYYPLLDKDS